MQRRAERENDYAIIRPTPDDPVRTLRGVYAAPGPDSAAAREAERAAEQASDDHVISVREEIYGPLG
jgi:hypothetical protein